MADSVVRNGPSVTVFHYLMPIGAGWAALFPRTKQEWRELRFSNPFAQRFFGGKPAGFFGDYRRKRTLLGNALVLVPLLLFTALIYFKLVQTDLFIIGFLYIGSLAAWIMRLEISGDRVASIIRQVATMLVYQQDKSQSS